MLSELNFIHDEFQFLRICCCSITRLFNHREAFSKQSSSMEGSGPFSTQVVHYLNSTMEPPPTTITKTDTTTEEVDNPDYDSCIVKDQQILNYLLSSPFRDILAQVATLFRLLLLFWDEPVLNYLPSCLSAVLVQLIVTRYPSAPLACQLGSRKGTNFILKRGWNLYRPRQWFYWSPLFRFGFFSFHIYEHFKWPPIERDWLPQ